MKRHFVNLVTRHSSFSLAEEIYSVRRVDPYHHFFYGSAEAALQAADDAAKKNEPFPATQTLHLPSPIMNFDGRLDMFALLGRGRMVYASPISEAGLYDADRNLHYGPLPRLHPPKGLKPMCLSIAADGEDSMYVRGCFQVLESTLLPEERRRVMRHLTPPWCWRLLPPPPFLHEPDGPFVHRYGYKEHFSVTSFAAVANGNGGHPTIYISFDRGIGTYGFNTASSDSPEAWSHVGEWRLPFRDRAQYVPEFDLWFGFLDSSPNHLCAVDLSSAAMDREQGRPPAVQHVWQDLVDLPEGEEWFPWQLELVLVDLGDGKFLIAKTFEAEATGESFALLTGVEMMMAGDQSLQMVKHKCARFVFGIDTIEWVL